MAAIRTCVRTHRSGVGPTVARERTDCHRTRDWRTDLDYDGFDWGTGPYPFVWDGTIHYSVEAFAQASGLQRHGIRIHKESCFQDFQMYGQTPTPVPPHRMSLQPTCNAVDAGAVLPNVNDGFTGARTNPGAGAGSDTRAGTGSDTRARLDPALCLGH